MNFEDLPIMLDSTEYQDGWQRDIKKQGTIADLLEIWDINNPSENSVMAQVLRLLKFHCGDDEQSSFNPYDGME
jgi:hypothetical protein